MLSSPRDVDGRLVHLDVFRILSCAGVVYAHCYDASLVTNAAYGQQWGLQLLLLICGMLWSMSRTPFWVYALRLFIFFCLGIFCNWLSIVSWPDVGPAVLPDGTWLPYAVVGADWKSDLFNIVFQMWFVFAVMICVLATAPLKWALNQRGSALWKAAAAYIAIALASNAIVGSGWWTETFTDILLRYGGAGGKYYAPFVPVVGFYLCQYFSMLAATSLVLAWLLSSVQTSAKAEPRITLFVAWAIIFYAYASSIYWYEPLGAWVHDFLLFLVGMVVQRFSMFGQAPLARFITSYWPLVIIFPLGAMHIPDAPHRRIDMWPFHDMFQRARFSGIEIMFILSFTVCATPAEPLGRRAPVVLCSDPYDVLGWLNRWALFAYMCHMAFLRMLPLPFNWITVFLCPVAFYAEDKMLEALKKPKAAEVFGYAWLVLLFPYFVLLWTHFSYWSLAGIVGYGALIIAINKWREIADKKRTSARTYTVCSDAPDGVWTPLTSEDHLPLWIQ